MWLSGVSFLIIIALGTESDCKLELVLPVIVTVIVTGFVTGFVVYLTVM